MNRFVITWVSEYGQFFYRFNWYTITLFNLSFEYEKMLEGISVDFIILGLGFHLRYNLPASDAIYKKFEEETEKVIKKAKKKKTKKL